MTIDCLAENSTGINPQEIKWKHEGKELLIDNNVKIIKPSENEIEIKNLDYADAGQYSCFSGNYSLNTTNLIVQGKLFSLFSQLLHLL